ncbi:MAG: hypothetical protein ACK50M_07370 [Cyclobacteriaceae bacterium]|jgi:hypothetical protein
MSNLGTKSLIFILALLGCTHSKENLKKRKEYIEFAMKEVGTKDYLQVYSSLNDSIRTWSQNRLGYYRYLGYSKHYEIDSLICFNNEKDKIIGALLMQQLLTEGVQDDIKFLYGVKLNDLWHFYSGPIVVLPREYYQKDIHTPLSWEKLHELAMTEIFSGYLRRDAAGQWQINDHFFDDIIPKNEPVARGYGECFECNTEEEYVLYRVRKNWRERDTISQVLAQPPG